MANENGWIQGCVGVGLTRFGGCALLYDCCTTPVCLDACVGRGLGIPFLSVFCGRSTGGHPRLRTGNGGNAMSCGMCGDDHRHWLGTAGLTSADRRYAQGPRWVSGPDAASGRRNGCGPAARAVHREPSPAAPTYWRCGCMSPRRAGRGLPGTGRGSPERAPQLRGERAG